MKSYTWPILHRMDRVAQSCPVESRNNPVWTLTTTLSSQAAVWREMKLFQLELCFNWRQILQLCCSLSPLMCRYMWFYTPYGLFSPFSMVNINFTPWGLHLWILHMFTPSSNVLESRTRMQPGYTSMSWVTGHQVHFNLHSLQWNKLKCIEAKNIVRSPIRLRKVCSGKEAINNCLDICIIFYTVHLNANKVLKKSLRSRSTYIFCRTYFRFKNSIRI